MGFCLENSEYVGWMDLVDQPTHALLYVKEGKTSYVQAISAIHFQLFSLLFTSFLTS